MPVEYAPGPASRPAPSSFSLSVCCCCFCWFKDKEGRSGAMCLLVMCICDHHNPLAPITKNDLPGLKQNMLFLIFPPSHSCPI